MSEFARIMFRLWRLIIYRRLPHGLISWRYFVPSQDARVRLHRTLWLQSRRGRPWVFWLMLEVWLWLRWLGYYAWKSTWIAVRYYGPSIRLSEGISLPRQAWQALSLALGWCIPASKMYCFFLYKNPQSTLDYVFDQEVFGYHRWSSRSLGFGKDSLALLQDKWKQTETLSLLGVPMAPILAMVRKCDGERLSLWLQKDTHLFCKMCSGNQGIGAFSAWNKRGEIGGQMLDGRELHGMVEVESAWCDLLAKDDAIVQPYLENHPALAALSDGDDAATVRFISQWNKGQPTFLGGMVVLPAGRDEKTGRRIRVILPLDELGNILHFPESKLLPLEMEMYDRIHGRLTGSNIIPHWKELAVGSFLSHHQFSDICAIAWDWVVTPGGPLLLEGNSGWGLEIHQQINGGMLRQ